MIPRKNQHTLSRETFRSRYIILGLVFAVVGLSLVLMSDTDRKPFGFDLSTVLSTVGTIFLIYPLSNLFFEIAGKERLFDEIVARSDSAKHLSECGLERVYPDSTKIDYSQEIRKSQKILALFSYSGNFLRNNQVDLLDAISRGASVEIIRLSEASKTLSLMKEMGWEQHSFDHGSSAVREFIERAEKRRAGSVKDIQLDFIPRYSCVAFETSIYVIENTCHNGRTRVPATRIEVESTLGQFYIRDLNELKSDAQHNRQAA